MFFGMINSPPTFQNMMNDVLKDVIDKGIIIVFIDNILIFMEDEEHHEEIVEEVLKRSKENDLFLKPEKEGDRIFGNGYWREGSKDGYDKSGSNYVMADAEACEG